VPNRPFLSLLPTLGAAVPPNKLNGALVEVVEPFPISLREPKLEKRETGPSLPGLEMRPSAQAPKFILFEVGDNILSDPLTSNALWGVTEAKVDDSFLISAEFALSICPADLIITFLFSYVEIF
jgi:hypothetical protein